MTIHDKKMIETMATAIYKSDKGYIADMQQCKKAARHALKALNKYLSKEKPIES